MPDVSYIQIAPEFPLPAIQAGPSRAVLIATVPVSTEWQRQASKWLIEAGCLYMMAWGIDCSSWDDSVDMANLDKYDFKDIPDASSIMTTWHAEQPLKDVFWFSKNAAEHPVAQLCRTMIVDISLENRSRQILECYAAA